MSCQDTMSNVARISAIFIIFAIFSVRLICGINYKDCECGVDDNIPTRKSAGGWQALPRQFPWVVAVDFQRKQRFAGALINTQYVLVAGRCCKTARIFDITVVITLTNRISPDSARIPAFKIILPADFRCSGKHCDYDAALIKLRIPAETMRKVSPICLPKSDPGQYNILGTVTGWAKEPNSGRLGVILQQTHVQILANQVCKGTLGNYYNADYHICADIAIGKSCKADSGGLLIYEFEPSKWTVIGIVSWDEGCEGQDVPSMYTKVVYFLDWIHKNTEDASYCNEKRNG